MHVCTTLGAWRARWCTSALRWFKTPNLPHLQQQPPPTGRSSATRYLHIRAIAASRYMLLPSHATTWLPLPPVMAPAWGASSPSAAPGEGPGARRTALTRGLASPRRRWPLLPRCCSRRCPPPLPHPRTAGSRAPGAPPGPTGGGSYPTCPGAFAAALGRTRRGEDEADDGLW